jgi:hypothetical protein
MFTGTSGSSCASNDAAISLASSSAMAVASFSGSVSVGVRGEASIGRMKFVVHIPSMLGAPNDVRGAAYPAGGATGA